MSNQTIRIFNPLFYSSMNSSLLLHDLIPEDIWIDQLIPLLGLRACCRGTFVSRSGNIRFKKQVSINSLVLRVPEDIVNLNEAIAVYETYLRPQRSAAYEQKWKDAPEEHDNEEQTRPCDILIGKGQHQLEESPDHYNLTVDWGKYGYEHEVFDYDGAMIHHPIKIVGKGVGVTTLIGGIKTDGGTLQDFQLSKTVILENLSLVGSMRVGDFQQDNDGGVPGVLQLSGNVKLIRVEITNCRVGVFQWALGFLRMIDCHVHHNGLKDGLYPGDGVCSHLYPSYLFNLRCNNNEGSGVVTSTLSVLAGPKTDISHNTHGDSDHWGLYPISARFGSNGKIHIVQPLTSTVCHDNGNYTEEDEDWESSGSLNYASIGYTSSGGDVHIVNKVTKCADGKDVTIMETIQCSMRE